MNGFYYSGDSPDAYLLPETRHVLTLPLSQAFSASAQCDVVIVKFHYIHHWSGLRARLVPWPSGRSLAADPEREAESVSTSSAVPVTPKNAHGGSPPLRLRRVGNGGRSERVPYKSSRIILCLRHSLVGWYSVVLRLLISFFSSVFSETFSRSSDSSPRLWFWPKLPICPGPKRCTV